jgi:hypothetical protein
MKLIQQKAQTFSLDIYEDCPENIQPFWTSLEPVAWPWCDLARSSRRPYCASVNSRSRVGLVSWQWDAVDWACVLRDRRIHYDRASRSASLRQCACPFYSFRAGPFAKASHHAGLSAPLQPKLALCDFWLFPELKSPSKRRRLHKDSQWRLTSNWLAYGKVTVHGCTVRSLLTGWKVNWKPRKRFWRYSKWLDTFRIDLAYCNITLEIPTCFDTPEIFIREPTTGILHKIN